MFGARDLFVLRGGGCTSLNCVQIEEQYIIHLYHKYREIFLILFNWNTPKGHSICSEGWEKCSIEF